MTGKHIGHGKGRTESGPAGNHAWWRMPAILLALAGVVVIATLMVSLRDTGVRDQVGDDGDSSKANEAQRVIVGAKAFLRSGRRDEALRLMRSYIRIKPDDSTVRVMLAETYLAAGETDEAGKVVEQLLRIAPDLPTGLWLKGRLLRRKGQKGWRDYFRRAAESPDAPAKVLAAYGMLKFLDRDDKEARKYLMAAHRKGMDGPDILAALGEIAARANKYGEAQKWLEQAVRKDERIAAAWRILADVQRRAGRRDQAALTLMRALRKVKRWKDRPDLWFDLGEIRAAQRKHQSAGEAYAKASDGKSGWFLAALRAGRSYYLAGRYALAMKYVDRAFRLNPSDEQAKAWRAKIEDARFGPANAASSRPITTHPAP